MSTKDSTLVLSLHLSRNPKNIQGSMTGIVLLQAVSGGRGKGKFTTDSLSRFNTQYSSWQTDEETVGTVRDFVLGGTKIAADGDCSHEIKRRLLLRRKVTTNLDSILKSRDFTLPTKVHLVKAMVFPVVMYGCESWTIE